MQIHIHITYLTLYLPSHLTKRPYSSDDIIANRRMLTITAFLRVFMQVKPMTCIVKREWTALLDVLQTGSREDAPSQAKDTFYTVLTPLA